MRNRPMTASELRWNDMLILSIVLVAGPFILRDLFLSFAKDVPRLGVLGYVTGPIFAHKLSEIFIAGAWIWFAFMYNHEKSNLYPSWMPPQRYQRSLHVTAIVMLWSTVLATYAWTILNFGTSVRTTNLADPPGIGEEWLVWRYYLGAVVIAGGAYVMLAVGKIVRSKQS